MHADLMLLYQFYLWIMISTKNYVKAGATGQHTPGLKTVSKPVCSRQLWPCMLVSI